MESLFFEGSETQSKDEKIKGEVNSNILNENAKESFVDQKSGEKELSETLQILLLLKEEFNQEEVKETKKVKELEEVKAAKELEEVKAAKELEEVKAAKELEEVKEFKEIKETKEVKEFKEVNEVNEVKELKETKVKEKFKELKEIKETKELEEGTKVTEKIKILQSEDLDNQKKLWKLEENQNNKDIRFTSNPLEIEETKKSDNEKIKENLNQKDEKISQIREEDNENNNLLIFEEKEINEKELNACIKIQKFYRKWKRIKDDVQKLIKLKQNHKVRTHIVQEIFQTEKSYVETLNRLKKGIIEPSRNMSLTLPNDLGTTFDEIEKIHSNHIEFLANLTEVVNNWSPSKIISKTFNRMTENFLLYDTYATKYNNCIDMLHNPQKLDPQFSLFLTGCYKRMNTTEDLSSFLITPIQRIPRYALLLESLSKNTDEEHIDSKHLFLTVATIKHVVNTLNDQIKQAENYQKIQEIQKSILDLPHSLLRRGRLFQKKINVASKFSLFTIFLFNDTFIWTTSNISSATNELRFCRIDFLSDINIKHIKSDIDLTIEIKSLVNNYIIIKMETKEDWKFFLSYLKETPREIETTLIKEEKEKWKTSMKSKSKKISFYDTLKRFTQTNTSFSSIELPRISTEVNSTPSFQIQSQNETQTQASTLSTSSKNSNINDNNPQSTAKLKRKEKIIIGNKRASLEEIKRPTESSLSFGTNGNNNNNNNGTNNGSTNNSSTNNSSANNSRTNDSRTNNSRTNNSRTNDSRTNNSRINNSGTITNNNNNDGRIDPNTETKEKELKKSTTHFLE